LSLPERYGPFVLLQRLADAGGEGFRARRVVGGGLAGPVRLTRPRVGSQMAADRLCAQAAYGARIAHPSVVRVLEVGFLSVSSGRSELYAVAELAEGVDLRAALLACEAQGAALPVESCCAISLQLATLAREVHERREGELLGHLRPEDVVLGWDGRVRVRARGEHPEVARREDRDPFLAPELARGGRASPAADSWTLGRLLRATLATDPDGKRPPKVSAAFKDTLGPLLAEALTRSPQERLAVRALQSRLRDLLQSAGDSPIGAVADLCARLFPGGAAEADEPLSLETVRALIASERSPKTPERLFPRAGAPPAADARAPQAGATQSAGTGTHATDLFDRILSAAERESIPERAGATSSRPVTVERTVRVERPVALSSSEPDEGDVFATPSAPSKLAIHDSGEAATARGLSPASSMKRRTLALDADADDVFTGVRPAAMAKADSAHASTRMIRKNTTGERGTDDPERTAFLENPHLAPDNAPPKLRSRSSPEQAEHDLEEVDDLDDVTQRIAADVAFAAAAAAALFPRPAPQAAPHAAEPFRAAEGAHDSLSLSDADTLEPERRETWPTEPSLDNEEGETGVLVVDVPDRAVVFLNGEQRGQGRTVVSELDRFATYQVRVHLQGFRPWTGAVTLQGMQVARVAPELKRR
jgi:hypothetical protein